MARPLFYEVVQQPATCSLVSILCCIWLLIKSRGLGYGDVGLSYDTAVQNKEIWRVVTSQLSHIDLLHLLFNVSSAWSLRSAEAQGFLYYVHTSLLLMLLSAAVYCGALYLLIFMARQEQYRHVTVVGYSCVVFGWMTLLSVRESTKFSILGLAELPMIAAPFASLILTSLIFPRASFLGHLSGIIVGYLVALGAFDWLTPWWLLTLLAWAAALGAWQLLRSRQISLPFLQLQTQDDIEAGPLLSNAAARQS